MKKNTYTCAKLAGEDLKTRLYFNNHFIGFNICYELDCIPLNSYAEALTPNRENTSKEIIKVK